MSLNAELIGDFDADDLRDAILQPRDEWREWENPRIDFSYLHPHLAAVGADKNEPLWWDDARMNPGVRQRASVWFRMNTAHLNESRELLLRCTVRALEATPADMFLVYIDYPRLMRRNGKLSLFRYYPHGEDLWDNDSNRELIPEPYDWIRVPMKVPKDA